MTSSETGAWYPPLPRKRRRNHSSPVKTRTLASQRNKPHVKVLCQAIPAGRKLKTTRAPSTPSGARFSASFPRKSASRPRWAAADEYRRRSRVVYEPLKLREPGSPAPSSRLSRFCVPGWQSLGPSFLAYFLEALGRIARMEIVRYPLSLVVVTQVQSEGPLAPACDLGDGTGAFVVHVLMLGNAICIPICNQFTQVVSY